MRFRDEWSFLSNFYPAAIKWQGHVFPTAEHLYQALKCTDTAEAMLIRTAGSPSAAKRLGRKALSIRPDWEDVKVDVMRDVVYEKFKQNPSIAKKLIATHPRTIVEDNTWGDTFWGMCNGKGKNMLGLILMDVRGRLAKESK